MNENRKAHDSVARVVQEMRDQALSEYSAQTSFSPTLVRWANRLAALSASPTPAADDANVEREARRLFERNSSCWSVKTPWDELHPQTRELWHAFALKRFAAIANERGE